MSMNLSTPQDIKMRTYEGRIQDLVNKIEMEFLQNRDRETKFDVIVSGEWPKDERDDVAKRYEKAGWKKVTHRTSSENNERGGLTRFTFEAE